MQKSLATCITVTHVPSHSTLTKQQIPEPQYNANCFSRNQRTQQQTLLNVNFTSRALVVGHHGHPLETIHAVTMALSVARRSFQWRGSSSVVRHFFFNIDFVFGWFVQHCRRCRRLVDEVRYDVTKLPPETFRNGDGGAIVGTDLEWQSITNNRNETWIS